MPRDENYVKIFTCHWEFDPNIQVDTLKIIGNSNIHTSTICANYAKKLTEPYFGKLQDKEVQISQS